MTFTPLPEPGSLGVVQFPMHRFTDRHGPFLMGRDQGQIARAELERALFGRQTGEEPVYIDFSGVQGMSVPFAEGFFVPLLSSRAIPGYYGEHPIVVAHAQPDVADTVSAVLRQSNLAVVSLQTDAVADLLGGEPSLRETVRAAGPMGNFSAQELADLLGLTAPAANNRLRQLVQIGALIRRPFIPARGGREYRYHLPGIEESPLVKK